MEENLLKERKETLMALMNDKAYVPMKLKELAILLGVPKEDRGELEAVLKALGTGFSEGIGWLDVEVRRTSKGRPYVVLTGRAREVAREQGVREIPLSLSYTHTDAVACAMAITEESVAAIERRRDPMEELTRQFKDARALLDDLPGAPAAG